MERHGTTDIPQFRKTVEKNISTANGWGWANGAWTVQSQADKLNLQYAASYADSPSMESLWATLETQEDEFYLQVLTGNTTIDEFDRSKTSGFQNREEQAFPITGSSKRKEVSYGKSSRKEEKKKSGNMQK